MDRRTVLTTSSLAFLGLAFPSSFLQANKNNSSRPLKADGEVPQHFPNLDPEIIAEVVGKSHFDLDRVKTLVDKRPELSRSVWEWRFGDFESAIGAASHVGRRDIAQYLISKGARPTIFTFAMLGHFDIIKAVVKSNPGIQKTTGPHGISLLDHAYAGERMKDQMTSSEIEQLKKTIDYLESLGDAGVENYPALSTEEQEKYLGDYRYGSGENEGFTVGVNMRKLLSLAPLGGFGGALYNIGEHKFTYNGAPSVTISFEVEDDSVHSLKIVDPEVTVVAEKV